MPLLHGRHPIASDFEDILLYDPKDTNKWRVQRDSQSSQDSASSDGSRSDDPHSSIQSFASNISTPTLASDTSSLRSSYCSVSSPTLNTHTTSVGGTQVSPESASSIQTTVLQEKNVTAQAGTAAVSNKTQLASSGYGRRKSVPSLVDTTSMASLTIRAQARARSRRREMEFEADQDDDIWPGDTLMFNVPMSPALYAQQKKQQNRNLSKLATQTHYPRTHDGSKVWSPQTIPNQAQMPVDYRRTSTSSLPLNPSLPSIHEQPRRSWSSAEGTHHVENHIPSSRTHAHQPRDSEINALPSLLSRRGSYMTDPNSSIEGLDSDTSDLTLKLYRLGESQERRSSSANNDNSRQPSLESLSRISSDDALPTPSMISTHDSPGSDADSRRSSLTRPENLPPKTPEEERKHLREYEKLLKEAAAAERRKQQKLEEEKKRKSHQVKQDTATWSHWLASGARSKVNPDMYWRGIPEKTRGAVWHKVKSSPAETAAVVEGCPSSATLQAEIAKDSERMWPDCCIFGKGRPLHEPLVDLVLKFLQYRPDIEYKFALTGIAATLLLYLDTSDALDVMKNLIVPGSLVDAILRGNERLTSAIYVAFDKAFRRKFEQLALHFSKVGLTYPEFLDKMISGLFSTVIQNPESAARIIDVFIFEGDAFLLRAALGILRINEAWLYASKEEIIEQLMKSRQVSDDNLMKCIRDVTRH